MILILSHCASLDFFGLIETENQEPKTFQKYQRVRNDIIYILIRKLEKVPFIKENELKLTYVELLSFFF